MSCNLGLQQAWHGFGHEHGLTNSALRLQSRGAGSPLTNLKRWHARTFETSGFQGRAAARDSVPNSTDGRGTLADALVGSVTQTLALGLSAASMASDSLARLQRIVGPLPSGFPPGEDVLHALGDPLMPQDPTKLTQRQRQCTNTFIFYIVPLQAQAQTWQSTF